MSQTSPQSDWAKKETLDRIAKATESSADSLQDMLNSSSKGLKRLESATSESATSTRASSRAQQDAAEKSKGLGKAFGDLYTTLKGNNAYERERRGRSAREFGTNLSDTSTMFRNATERVTSAVSSLPLLGPIIGVSIGAISGFVSQLLSTKDMFINMVDSGIMFDGSISGFRTAVGNAGLTVEQFGALVEQSGQAIKLFGENKFLESTVRLRSTFDQLGLSVTQGNEYFAEYLENSRLSSNLYFRTEEEHRQGFEDNLKMMREQARLTGVSVRQQRDQQRALAQSLEYQVMIRSLSPDRRRYIESQRAAILPAAGADFANEFFTFVQTRAPKSGGFLQALQTYGGGQQIQALAERARRGEQLSIEDFQNAIVSIPEHVFGQALAQLRGSNPELVQRLMDVRMPAEAAVRARAIARGENPPPGALGPEVVAATTAQNALNDALKEFQSLITSIGAGLLNSVMPQLTSFTNAMRTFNQAPDLATAMRDLEAGGDLSEGLTNVLASYRTGGLFSAAGTAFTEGFKTIGGLIWEGMKAGWDKVTEYFTSWKNSLIERLGTWGNSLIDAFQNLPIIRWFRNNPNPVPNDPYGLNERQTPTPGVPIPGFQQRPPRSFFPGPTFVPPAPPALPTPPGSGEPAAPASPAALRTTSSIESLPNENTRLLSQIAALMTEGNAYTLELRKSIEQGSRMQAEAFERAVG